MKCCASCKSWEPCLGEPLVGACSRLGAVSYPVPGANDVRLTFAADAGASAVSHYDAVKTLDSFGCVLHASRAGPRMLGDDNLFEEARHG